MSSLTEASTSNALRPNLDSSLTSRIPMRFALQYPIASHNTGRSSFFLRQRCVPQRPCRLRYPYILHTPTSPWPVFPCSVCHQYWRHERILLLLLYLSKTLLDNFSDIPVNTVIYNEVQFLVMIQELLVYIMMEITIFKTLWIVTF